MDDDVASIVGLIVLLNQGRSQSWSKEPITVTHLTLSLYLLTKCEIMGRTVLMVDPGTLSSMAVILDWVAVAQKAIPADAFVDHFLLKLVDRKAVLYITDELDGPNIESFVGSVNIDLACQWYDFEMDGVECEDAPLGILFEIGLEIIDGNISLERTHSWEIAKISP